MRSVTRAGPILLILSLFPVAGYAQEGGLEVLEGETLYQEGWLFTLSDTFTRQSRLFEGEKEVRDSLDRVRMDHRLTSSVNYGALPDLTLTALLPFVYRTLESDAGDAETSGIGDVTLVAKYRIFRTTAHRASDNLAALLGLELPTGSDTETENGARLPMTLQPGSGSWDPFAGLAATFERDRWKFNGVWLYQLNTEGGQDYKFGDELVLDLAVGNRFWIEKYPGPSASGTFGLRWKHEFRARQDGDGVTNTGGDTISARLSFVFHPRPVWDIVATLEVPLYHRVNGTQLVDDFSLFIAIGFRI
ncbi:MAG: hypothetical protein O7H41_16865 [Planctomycetota bacterium]|nr:hypothetical protein [Planctomycetota bacterium]